LVDYLDSPDSNGNAPYCALIFCTENTLITILALGLRPRLGHGKVRAESASRSHIYTPKMWESVREWTHTLPSGLPLWELESLWSFESSKSNFKGKNSLDWKLLYIIRKLLKCKCVKWAHTIHLNTYNTSYGQNKGRKSKCQFDSWPLKVRNHLDVGACRWHATGFGKLSTRDTTLIEVDTRNYGPPKWREYQFQEFWDPWLGSPTKNDICALVANHRKYYKREGDGFPQV